MLPLMVQLQSRATPASSPQPSLYEQDFHRWLQTTVTILREKRLTELDTIHLAEELERLQRQGIRSIRRSFTQLLLHILNFHSEMVAIQQAMQTIQRYRYQVIDELDASPSLRDFLAANFEAFYADARQQMLADQRSSLRVVPVTPCFTLDEVLDMEFFPEVD
jgi:hypothetical protein